MVQFNLLPDVKQQFIKARNTKRLVTLGAIVLSIVSLFVLLLFFVTVNVLQKKSLSDLRADIQSTTRQIKSIKDLDKILTVQNQLNALTSLHDKKVVTSRLFTYLPQFTPPGIGINQLNVDYAQNTMSISGTAPSLESISGYVGTLKATTYQLEGANSSQPVFKDVKLGSFGRGDKGANSSFAVTFGFDPVIFDSSKTATLAVPKGTISNTTILFQEKK